MGWVNYICELKKLLDLTVLYSPFLVSSEAEPKGEALLERTEMKGRATEGCEEFFLGRLIKRIN
ncbi:hypothetical protein AYK26_07140 [Euryarchaeota archaeon SM23-78]|nr:MAG: hypothetical protein AYK26_07140 [Euryarchaeota archaeon SM23-78]